MISTVTHCHLFPTAGLCHSLVGLVYFIYVSSTSSILSVPSLLAKWRCYPPSASRLSISLAAGPQSSQSLLVAHWLDWRSVLGTIYILPIAFVPAHSLLNLEFFKKLSLLSVERVRVVLSVHHSLLSNRVQDHLFPLTQEPQLQLYKSIYY